MDSDINSKMLAKPEMFDVLVVNGMLKQLEGQHLSYTVFARDTKSARSRYSSQKFVVNALLTYWKLLLLFFLRFGLTSSGPPTECILYHARAAIAELPSTEYVSSLLCKISFHKAYNGEVFLACIIHTYLWYSHVLIVAVCHAIYVFQYLWICLNS